MSVEKGAAEPKPSGTIVLKSLEEHAAVHAAVVASSLDAVIVVDEAGVVLAVNPAAEATFGYSSGEAVGRSIGDLIVPEHFKQAHEAGMTRYKATRVPHVLGRRVEMPALCKDGSIIPVELAITEVVLRDRRLFTANLRDLSEAKAAAAEIERQRAALHQSEKLAAIGSLLAGVAHELNNPLSIVLGQAIMMREEAAANEAHASIRDRAVRIEAAAERCARVVKSFLAIARQRKAERRAVALPPLLDGAIDLLVYSMRSSGVTVLRDYGASLPDVLADPDQVGQIVVNLLVNSAQALESAHGRREIRVRARVELDETLLLTIADNGPGVPPEIAGRIFEPFFTTKPPGSGTGIGLSVSRALAESQKGSLRLGDSPFGGAAFELILPLAAATSEKVSPSFSAAKIEQFDARPAMFRALVIDDEPDIAALLAETLGKAGYHCDIAGSGREAQALMSENGMAYDAVLCDLRMPDIDGPALFSWMQIQWPALCKRTVFVTGDALGASAGRFLAECQRPVLEKPFSLADILRHVRGVSGAQ